MTSQEWGLHRQVVDIQEDARNYREIAAYYEASLQSIVRSRESDIMRRIAVDALRHYEEAEDE